MLLHMIHRFINTKFTTDNELLNRYRKAHGNKEHTSKEFYLLQYKL